MSACHSLQYMRVCVVCVVCVWCVVCACVCVCVVCVCVGYFKVFLLLYHIPAFLEQRGKNKFDNYFPQRRNERYSDY